MRAKSHLIPYIDFSVRCHRGERSFLVQWTWTPEPLRSTGSSSKAIRLELRITIMLPWRTHIFVLSPLSFQSMAVLFATHQHTGGHVAEERCSRRQPQPSPEAAIDCLPHNGSDFYLKFAIHTRYRDRTAHEMTTRWISQANFSCIVRDHHGGSGL